MEEKERTCPRCHKKYKDYPALSRRDNETLICPDCGTHEAFEDFFNLKFTEEKYWK